MAKKTTKATKTTKKVPPFSTATPHLMPDKMPGGKKGKGGKSC